MSRSGPTPRELAHARTLARIVDLGRRQLGEVGPAQLSLRAIARELGVSSSAVYRYVASRDELLTRLIVRAYADLGAAVESAVEGAGAGARPRWSAACAAIRTWALAHPHEWTLIYGTPVPGYVAPESTLAPASRVARVLVAIVAGDRGRSPRPVDPPPVTDPGLASRLSDTAAGLGVDLPPADTAALVRAWSQLVGTLTLELGGHYAGTVEPVEPYWDHLVATLADELLAP